MWIFTNNHINFNSNCSSMIQSVEVDEYQVIIGGNCCWTSFKAIRDSWLGYIDSASDFFWSLFRLLFWPICRKRIQSAFSVLQPSAYERVMQSVYTIKSTHNRFQHYKKNDINVALSFFSYRLEVNFIRMPFTVIMLYTIKTNATIIALALKFCHQWNITFYGWHNIKRRGRLIFINTWKNLRDCSLEIYLYWPIRVSQSNSWWSNWNQQKPPQHNHSQIFQRIFILARKFIRKHCR